MDLDWFLFKGARTKVVDKYDATGTRERGKKMGAHAWLKARARPCFGYAERPRRRGRHGRQVRVRGGRARTRPSGVRVNGRARAPVFFIKKKQSVLFAYSRPRAPYSPRAPYTPRAPYPRHPRECQSTCGPFILPPTQHWSTYTALEQGMLIFFVFYLFYVVFCLFLNKLKSKKNYN